MKERVFSFLAALVMAGGSLALPLLTAHRQEAALTNGVHTRQEPDGILWDPAVRGSTVLYALHRLALLENDFTAGRYIPEQPADAAVVRDQAAALLDVLYAGGILSAEERALLEPAEPDADTRAFMDDGSGVFGSLRLEGLAIHWHRESGLPIYVEISDPGFAKDSDALLETWCVMLGLDGLTDWTRTAGERGQVSRFSAQGQVTLLAMQSSDVFVLNLWVEYLQV